MIKRPAIGWTMARRHAWGSCRGLRDRLPSENRRLLGRYGSPFRSGGHVFVVILILCLLVPTARAGEPLAGHYRYSIRHTLFGEIGTQTLHLERKGHQAVVTLQARVKIRFLSMTLLSLDTKGHEVWRDGRLVAFESRSEEDGQVLSLSVRAAQEETIFDGPNGRVVIRGPVASTNPWRTAVLDFSKVIEPTSGALLSLRSHAGGWRWIEVAGRRIKSRVYLVTGDLEATIWFDENGSLIRMEFFKAGGWVTVSLESFRAKPSSIAEQAARDTRLP